MPLYDFRCAACGQLHELLLKSGEHPPCPACGESRLAKLLSPFASPTLRGASGASSSPAAEAPSAKAETGGHVHTSACRHGQADSLIKKYLG